MRALFLVWSFALPIVRLTTSHGRQRDAEHDPARAAPAQRARRRRRAGDGKEI